MTELETTGRETAIELQREFGALSPAVLVEQIQLIQRVMSAVMRDGEHFGIIPGTQKKALYKAGAEKLSFVFRLRPEYEVETIVQPGGHREVRVRCRLFHIQSGNGYGEGVGSCSTQESKYRWRNAQRECPSCRQPAIRRSKYLDPETNAKGWYCYDKLGGCGDKFASEDPEIVTQEVGRVENPDIADVYNTVLKMAKKRAHTDAVLTACAASDIFTQDLGDDPSERLPEEEEVANGSSAARAKPPVKEPPRRTTSPAAASHEAKAAEILKEPKSTVTRGKVARVTFKPTSTGGNRFTIVLQPDDGGEFLYASTFDEKLAVAARERAGDKLPCLLEWRSGKYGNDLLSFKVSPGAAEEPPENTDDLPF